MKSSFLWASVLLTTVLPAAHAQTGVYYSPVFHSPLQPAPSPSNGGFYWVLPDGRLQGPNYYLCPPFTPVGGFSTALVGQEIFANSFMRFVKSGSAQGAHHPAQQTPRNVGIGSYNQDYSEPANLSTFDPQNGLGYQPFPGRMQPPSPAVSTQASYQPHGYYPQYAWTGYGYGAPMQAMPMSAQAQQASIYHLASYQPVSGSSQVVPTQYPAPPAPAAPPAVAVPRGGSCAPIPIPFPCMPSPGYQPNLPGLPSPGYTPNMPGLAPCFPGLPSPGYTPRMPGLPNVGYTPAMPCLPNQFPSPGYSPTFPGLPSPSYSPRTPCLPSPGCTPPLCPSECGGTPGYYHPASIRSPRDFFMYGDNLEDQRLRERKALQVP